MMWNKCILKLSVKIKRRVTVTNTDVDPQINRIHTAKKTLSGRGGSAGNTNEQITVTWWANRENGYNDYMLFKLCQEAKETRKKNQ